MSLALNSVGTSSVTQSKFLRRLSKRLLISKSKHRDSKEADFALMTEVSLHWRLMLLKVEAGFYGRHTLVRLNKDILDSRVLKRLFTFSVHESCLWIREIILSIRSDVSEFSHCSAVIQVRLVNSRLLSLD